MNKIKKKIKKKIYKIFAGKVWLQPFFKALHEFSLAGLNFGGGDNVSSSGEKNVITYLSRHIDKGVCPVVFDVGANDGSYAQEVLVEFKSRVKLYCFEPSKKAFSSLRESMAGHDNVSLYNFGCSEAKGIVSIYADVEGSRLGSVFQGRTDHLGIVAPHKEEIQLEKLEEFCREQKIGYIDLLKIDVEGGELSVLKGAKSLIDSSSIGLIQFEFGGCNIASRTFFHDFFSMLNPKYRIYRVLRDGFVPVDIYKESDEVFLTTIYMAVLRKA